MLPPTRAHTTLCAPSAPHTGSCICDSTRRRRITPFGGRKMNEGGGLVGVGAIYWSGGGKETTDGGVVCSDAVRVEVCL